ncbi:hypothetical protein [uncultured Bifidobacterium sp.]|uniref:hypothetical protein n=1 Tax=uncultured Bifidobacterium sp. TaxID=165187 RepID=UPI0027DD42CB|nr:hypothetical protein [uncultured Bifidobacterium sp.]
MRKRMTGALGLLLAASLLMPGTAMAVGTADLSDGVPTPAGSLILDTSDGMSRDRVTDVTGFTVSDAWSGISERGTYWTPTIKGASLIVQDVGEWTDPAGMKHVMDMRVTVTDWHGLAALNIRHIDNEDRVEFGVIAGSWADPAPDRTWIELRLDLLAADGASLDGFSGVTGFADLDGGTTGYNEGWELVSGFDTVYTMADAHLTRYGDNGWAGIIDENEHTQDEHGLQHYLGATFDSTSLTVRYGIAAGQSRATTLMPLSTVSTWPLTYDLNAGTGAIPNKEQ